MSLVCVRRGCRTGRAALIGQRGRRALQRSRQLRRQRDGAERRGALVLAVACRYRFSQPSRVLLTPGVAALHVVLRVEVRPRVVGRSARVDDGERRASPERLERRQPRVQAEEAVEIDARSPRPWRPAGDGDRRPRLVVAPVRRRARPCSGRRRRRAGRSRRARFGRRRAAANAVRARNDGAKPEAHERKAAVLEEDASDHHGCGSFNAAGIPASRASGRASAAASSALAIVAARRPTLRRRAWLRQPVARRIGRVGRRAARSPDPGTSGRSRAAARSSSG